MVGQAQSLRSRAAVSPKLRWVAKRASTSEKEEAQFAMADMNERDAKLVQYLSEAYGKERELETALQAHIAMTPKGPYKKRLQQHLKETKSHAKQVERRIKKLGGGGQTLQGTVGKLAAAAKGPLHAIRGDSEQEKMLKNAKTEYWNEHEEIATYLAIETLAEKVQDSETAKLARGIRREEEKMAGFLQGQIKSLTGAVVRESVPAALRRAASKGKSSSKKAAKKPAAKAPAKKSSGTKKASAKKGTAAKKPRARKASSKKAPARKPAAAKR
jgi:ferritin-like metal-binding protein YciE